MNEKPLERLNYHNGQRLEAADLKTEQDYHIRTRRWLNKSLYSAGIADGLEVRAVPGAAQVMVSPGLALDNDGREIILLEETQVEVYSYNDKDENDSTVVGNYLVIGYSEALHAHDSGHCTMRTEDCSVHQSTHHWGDPSRIQAQPKFSWVAYPPQPSSNQIVLARVELKDGCGEVHQVDAGARRNIGAASAAKVRQYALEGERIVATVPIQSGGAVLTGSEYQEVGWISFHIRGQKPSSVTLYIQGMEYSALAYTELGGHTHSSNATNKATEPASKIDPHQHTHNIATVDASPSTPKVYGYFSKIDASAGAVNTLRSVLLGQAPSPLDIFNAIGAIFTGRIGVYEPGPAPAPAPALGQPSVPSFMLQGITFIGQVSGDDGNGNTNSFPRAVEANLTEELGIRLTDLGHAHSISGTVGDVTGNSPAPTHTHQFSMEINSTDASIKARTGSDVLRHINDLQIEIDGELQTLNVLRQINDALSLSTSAAWVALGNGTDSHPFVEKGTGAIRLDFLPKANFGEGAHVIKLWANVRDGRANGGRVHYNLYIE